MKTLIITRKDVEKVLTPGIANETVEKAFRAYALGETEMPPKCYLTFQQGDLRSMPASIWGQGFNIAGIKSVNVHPENQKLNLPTVMAVVALTDPETGFPLAILDGTFLTGIRTGASGAVAAKYLSKTASKRAGFVGCGTQARTQLACIMEVRKLESVKVWKFSPDDRLASKFCSWARRRYGVKTMISREIDDVTTDVDILVCTTPSRKPLVRRVSPGTHINAIGADAEGKEEITPEILKKAKLVIDNWTQAAHSGEINVPVRDGLITRDDIYCEIGEITAGLKKGRESDEEITLFDSTGLAIQDISCAYIVFEALKDKSGIKRIRLF
ncbi:MAG: ornithine cyclodeaminase family protein [Deltaproteobacteria bacterium]|nr:ornithine cyclodeaminase family protein [Deltaproteobacteria bacterium]